MHNDSGDSGSSVCSNRAEFLRRSCNGAGPLGLKMKRLRCGFFVRYFRGAKGDFEVRAAQVDLHPLDAASQADIGSREDAKARRKQKGQSDKHHQKFFPKKLNCETATKARWNLSLRF
jgi:hypothetical protein